MPVHSLHVFDRKGKTLFTKTYAKTTSNNTSDEEQQQHQRQLLFGMLYSLRDVTATLSGNNGGGLHSIQTGAATLYHYETNSGLKFALYLTDPPTDLVLANTSAKTNEILRSSLQHIYHELWIPQVTQSPLYRPDVRNVYVTNFEPKLDAYLKSQSWFK